MSVALFLVGYLHIRWLPSPAWYGGWDGRSVVMLLCVSLFADAHVSSPASVPVPAFVPVPVSVSAYLDIYLDSDSV